MNKKRVLLGMCSWSNFPLLEKCINSLLLSMDLSIDGIAVVLNEADIDSINFLLKLKIPFVCLPENRGVLAIDYLKPFIENSEYFINSNDDMLFHAGFIEDLLEIMENNYPCSASCRLIENFESGNYVVSVDTSLKDIYSQETFDTFIENVKSGKYVHPYKIIGWMHPICVKSEDFLKIGGYSGNWDMDFYNGYARDDMYAHELWSLHNKDFLHICSNKSFVFHASSATMKRLSPEIRSNNNFDSFNKKTGMSIFKFREKVKFAHSINEK
jgi:GT2 family glycosyltransferase